MTNNTKEKRTDRILLLKAREGNTQSSTGLVDNRLFTGENNLHAIMDQQNLLWSFKYDFGAIPPALKQKFTNFQKAYECAEKYFNGRGVDIVGVVD